MFSDRPQKLFNVNCRIGSLETLNFSKLDRAAVNCRIGSLESCPIEYAVLSLVNCRIGSLETYA